MRRPWLLPLAPLYAAGLRVKNRLYGWRWLRVRRLRRPVISVGSLSAGGAGKTPVVLMLAELLGRHGVSLDVLSRGYGRGSGVVEEVDPEGSAARFGDEPVEMARRGLRVWVGADRFEAGKAAESEPHLNRDEAAIEVGHPRTHLGQPTSQNRDMGHPVSLRSVHLLDDGFQHRRLARDLDVVLLTAEDTRDWLLPAGNLREPLAALRRADVVVVREEERAALAMVDIGLTHAEVWMVRRSLQLPAARPGKPVVFCGIARPRGFFAMVREARCVAAGEIAFADHHAYDIADMEQLVAAARHAGADGFLTTAKDAVKISAEMQARLEEIGPLAVAELQLQVADEARVWERLRRVIE